MMAALFRHCSCFRTETEDIQVLDYRHCSLKDVPDNVFTYERTLEELNLDANEIKDLPRPLFHCHGLKILNLNDNDIESLPPAIAGLINLEELDVSHNSILNFPDNIKGCKHLSNLNASVNPLGKLPDGLTQLVNLTQLYLNDTFLDFLPANFGRLSQLQILELRENHLKALPKSMARLTELKRLDIGHNDFNELPEVVGSLTKLTELWCDSNLIMYIPDFIRNLKDLCCFDLSMNRIISISYEIDGCSQLHDLYLSFNKLKELPESIGNLRNLTMLKLDENRLRSLPNTIGSLSNLQEFILTTNDLTRLPPSIGLMRNLSVLNMDENFLESLPPEIGSCISLTILSVRTNRLHKIPHELGHIPRLSVLNISDNFIQNLPFSISRLCNLSAIWISENQNKPLVPFQSTVDPETGQRVLTCILLPQIPREDSDDGFSDRQSVAWESRQNRQIKFAGDGRVVDQPSSLVRLPTPYPKEMKAHAKHAKNLALKHHIDLPFEEKNLIDSNNIIANPDVTTSAIDLLAVAVKEAKISKPKSPLLSTMPKSSLPHDPSHTQEFNNLSKTMQFYEAGTMSAQPSNVVNNNLNSMNIQGDESRVEVNQSPRSEIIPNMNMINDPEKIRNSPLMVQKLMINNVIDSCDRGYRSDNDFLYDQSRSMLPTPDGYHSDWEAIGGKMHPANPQFPQKYPIMNSKLRTHHYYESPAPPFVKRNGFDEFPTQQLSNGPNANMQPTILSQPPGHNGMMDYLQQYHVSSIAKNVVRSNQNSPTSSIAQSRISSPSPIPPALQQPRLPLPDYNTALQRSSLYSKFLGPIDTCLAGAPPSYSSIYRVDSQPSSRISHASDSGSAMSSVNLDKAQRSPVSMYSTSYSSPNSELRSEIPSSRPSPPPVLPKPNSSHPSSRDSSSAKNLEEAVYKELNAIHSYASENANLDGSVIMKAVPANIINDVESASQSPINPKDDVVNHLGFTPISPAPNVQMSNQIVRPSLPIQQVPIKNAAGQWIFGSHKNPKVFPVVIEQNPDLGFTISSKNSQYPTSRGIFVESVVQDGPASSALKLGDKILEVDGIDFTQMDVGKATSVLNTCKNTLCLMISRDS